MPSKNDKQLGVKEEETSFSHWQDRWFKYQRAKLNYAECISSEVFYQTKQEIIDELNKSIGEVDAERDAYYQRPEC